MGGGDTFQVLVELNDLFRLQGGVFYETRGDSLASATLVTNIRGLGATLA